MTDKETTAVKKPDFWRNTEQIDGDKLDLSEEVIQLNRVAKVVKGGRRFSFSALVVVGDRNGHVGIGFGKANEVPESIQKAMQDGRKNLIKVPRLGDTIPYMVVGRFAAARVMLRPASEGTGLIAGSAVRSVLELAGLHNVLTKSLGSSNVLNILKAVINGLKSLRDAEEVARLRGRKLEDMVGPRRARQLRNPEDASIKATQLASDAESETRKKEQLVLTPSVEEKSEITKADKPSPETESAAPLDSAERTEASDSAGDASSSSAGENASSQPEQSSEAPPSEPVAASQPQQEEASAAAVETAPEAESGDTSAEDSPPAQPDAEEEAAAPVQETEENTASEDKPSEA